MTEFQMSAGLPDLSALRELQPNAQGHQSGCRKVARSLGIEHGTAFSGDTRGHVACTVAPGGWRKNGPLTVKINGHAVAQFTESVNIPINEPLWCRIAGGYTKNGTQAPYTIKVYAP